MHTLMKTDRYTDRQTDRRTERQIDRHAVDFRTYDRDEHEHVSVQNSTNLVKK